jgi:sterol desaturase/sphingolipid hydroxylase (fatty acid hydroxylase superfamily)
MPRDIRRTTAGRNKAANVAGAAVLGLGLLLIVMEARRPRRPPTEPKTDHDARDLMVGAIGAIATAAPGLLVAGLTRQVEARRWGLLKRLHLPPWLELAAGVALMDYTLYHWHVLTHRIPWLWRTHLPHHADLDLTAATGLRFHAAELLLSIPYRMAQVLLIGVGPRTFALWQRLTTASILFHHANLGLPDAVDRTLRRVIVTPRLHEIHHSAEPAQMNANWSSGLTLWDRLHGTLLQEAPAHIEIGAPEHPAPAQLNLIGILLLPFQRGRRPERPVL